MKKWSSIELAGEVATLLDDQWTVSAMAGPLKQPRCVDDPSLSTQHMLAINKICRSSTLNEV